MSLTLPSIQNFSSSADVNFCALRKPYEIWLQLCVALSWSFEKQKGRKEYLCSHFTSTFLKKCEILGYFQLSQVPLEILAKFHPQIRLGQGIQEKKIFPKYCFISHREKKQCSFTHFLPPTPPPPFESQMYPSPPEFPWFRHFCHA